MYMYINILQPCIMFIVLLYTWSVLQLEHKRIALADDVFGCSVVIIVSLTDLYTLFPLFGTCHIVHLWVASFFLLALLFIYLFIMYCLHSLEESLLCCT